MVFYYGNKPLTFAELKANPGSPILVRLKIDNQKNGQRGQIISQQAINIACCPVKACVARVLALLQGNAPLDTPSVLTKMTQQHPSNMSPTLTSSKQSRKPSKTWKQLTVDTKKN